jgi:hypothetical protein
MSSTKVSVAMPTRGLIYAKTIKSLINNGLSDFCIVDGLPIPDAHNEAVKQALTHRNTHILLVEDDMELPDGTLKALLKLNAYVACSDYALGDKGQWHCTYKQQGKIMFCGTGCMLVRREVFENIIPYPWFENDKTFDIKNWAKYNIPNKYGGQDVYFCYKVREMGLEIQEIPNHHCGHWRTKSLERVGDNKGFYTFFELDYKEA